MAVRTAYTQYALSLITVAAVSALNLWLHRWLGYQALALVYLLAVVLLALFVDRGPILFGTALTALGWNYLFAPPRFSFHISGFYDKMMLAMYFVVSLTVGQLTARLRATREAEVKAKLLEESERLGRALLSSVSHELRTPISAITAAVGSLRNAGGLNGNQQKLAAEIGTAAGRLNRVVQSLLSAARIQSGHLQPKLDWCGVQELVQAAVREAGDLLDGHPVEQHLEAGLPLVKADFVLLEQALANLLANAATHTPTGTCIEIAASVESNKLILEVADRGPGLPAEEVDRVFDLFHRSPAAKPGGTGLGLSIVKGFVEAQGGAVRAGNRPGGGAVFGILLPLREKPMLPEEAR